MTKQEEEDSIWNIYKYQGETPLEAITRFKKTYPEFSTVALTYAGRLDPLAEGVLVILGNNALHKKEKILRQDKEYLFEALLGISTDTYDLLGVPSTHGHWMRNVTSRDLRNALKSLTGEILEYYPPYSSKTVSGKPLFEWAREGKLKQIKLPSKKVHVYRLESLKSSLVAADDLLEIVKKQIRKVNGDFRQDEIALDWERLISTHREDRFIIMKLKAHVSSGTYVRSITNELGKILGTGACAYSIKRLRVGKWSIEESIR